MSLDVQKIEQAIYDVAVDHPMWVDGAGRPLEYTPQREALIADFIYQAGRAVMAALDEVAE